MAELNMMPQTSRPSAALRRVTGGVVRLGAPCVRAYMQSPVHWGKRRFWKLIGERFFWQRFPFATTTAFGATMHGQTGDIIPSAIYYFGIWEPHLTRFIQERLRPGDVFIDVGANIGYYTLHASKLVGPTGGVVAIEASPRIYRELLAHIETNRAVNTRPVRCAASDAPGELPLYGGPSYNAGGATTVQVDDAMLFECHVPAAPLDALLTPYEIDRARLIKIDVEGAEWSVAQGMRSVLELCRADLEIVMEVSPSRLAVQGSSPNQILDLFSSFGFHAYALENDYATLSYVPPVAPRPIRRIHEVTKETDVVLSRVDQACL